MKGSILPKVYRRTSSYSGVILTMGNKRLSQILLALFTTALVVTPVAAYFGRTGGGSFYSSGVGGQLSLKSIVQTSNGWNVTLTLTNTGSNKISEWISVIENSTAYIRILATYLPEGWSATITHQTYGSDYAYFAAYENEYYIMNGQSKDFTMLTSSHGFSLFWYIQNTQGGKPGRVPSGFLYVP